MIDESLFKRDHFQYQGKFYPLNPERCVFNVQIQTTFGLSKTLIATAEAGDASIKQDDIGSLSGFVGFDLPVPFDWTTMEGELFSQELDDDDDICIYTGWHQFAVWQSLEILQRVGEKYLMKLAWRMESGETATAFGEFSFFRILLYVDDKVLGERRRQMIAKYEGEENIPGELLDALDRDIQQSGWEVLCNLAPKARLQFEEPVGMPGNICEFKPK